MKRLSIRLDQCSIRFLRFPVLIPMIILADTVIAPLLGRKYARFLLAFYSVVFIVVLTRRMPKPSLAPFLYLYIYANFLALVIHFNAPASVLNAGSLIVSIVAIAGAAYYCVRRYGVQWVDLALERWLMFAVILSFVLSILLTALSWSTAPDYYPWKAFYTSMRLLLIQGNGVGQTPILWLMAFLSAFTIHRVASHKRHRSALIALLVLLILCLLATKSRLALVYIANILVMGLAYKKVPFSRFAVGLIPVLFSSGFLITSIFPPLAADVNLAARTAQNDVGRIVRITPKRHMGTNVFAGRNSLNQGLVSASLEQPLRGLGDNADILQYGVTRKGQVAYNHRQQVSISESVLRLAVKYGWWYFASLILFLASIPFALKKRPWRERILKIGLWGMCIESIASEGGMEVFYGISGLFLFILCIELFEAMPIRTRNSTRFGITATEATPQP